MISAKIGFRNLARNRWRTGLTLGGIALSVGFMVWILGFMEGYMVLMVQGATGIEVGQVQVHTTAFADNPRVYRSFPVDAEMIERIRGVDGVEAVTPRIKLNGLIGHERKSQVARLLGVDPVLEGEATPIRDGVVDGRWLADDPAVVPGPREVVLGQGLAQQLQVGPGDELVTFVEAADGSLGNDLLEVVGVVHTVNTAIDRMTVYMHVEDARFLAALEGEAHELTIKTGDLQGAREMAGLIAGVLDANTRGVDRSGGGTGSSEGAPDALLVRPWQEVIPSLYQMLEISRYSYWFSYLLIYLVAAVGILNTQRMSALERNREFGVLMAIGMRPRRMFRMILTESVVLGILGGLIGTALGVALTWYHATAGLNMAIFTEHGGYTFMGISFSDRMYSQLTPTAALQPILIMVGVALLAGLWPALKSARLDPAPTIAGRN